MDRLHALLLTLPLLALGACTAPADDDDDAPDPNGDQDGDGLTLQFETSIGTSDENADSDGDGFTDTFEQLANFRPWDPNDFPYTGGYPRGPQPLGSEWDEITAEDGWTLGDVSRNWTMTDQHGEEIRLKRFYGQVVMMDLSAEWCGPCREAAATLEAEYQDRADEGFVVMQLMLDGYTPGDRSPNIDRWIGDFGLTVPVFDDGEFTTGVHYVPSSGSWGIPTFTMLDRNFVIRAWDRAGFPPPWDVVDNLLAEEGPEVASWSLPDNADALRAELGFGESPVRGYVDAMP